MRLRLILASIFVLGVVASPATAQDIDQYGDGTICQTIVNIIVADNLDNDAIQETTTGDNVNEIAQELNVSPEIVQECANEAGVDVDDNGDGTTDGDGDTTEDVGDRTIINTPNKDLPVTSGPEFLLPASALLLGFGMIGFQIVRRIR